MSNNLFYDCRWTDTANDKFINDYCILQDEVFKNKYDKGLFKRKYIENIYGQSIIIVVYDKEIPIGARAFWRNDIDGVKAYQPGDVCVLEEYRGKGVFTEMTKKAFELLPSDAIIYTFPNSNSYPAHLKMGNKLVASYYPRLFSHRKYQKEHTLKLDKDYANWWFSENERIKYIKRNGCYYLVIDYGLPFIYMVLGEVDKSVAKRYSKSSIGLYFYRSLESSFYNKNKRPLYIVCKEDTKLNYIPTWKVDSLSY